MTKNELDIIKNSLPVGYIDELVIRTKYIREKPYSRGYISQVLNGKRKNLQIIDEAILLGNEEQAKIEARKTAIEKLGTKPII